MATPTGTPTSTSAASTPPRPAPVDAPPPRPGDGTPTAAPVRRRRTGTSTWRVAVLGALVPLTLLLAWHWASTTGVFAVYELPPPLAVWEAGVELVARDELGTHVAISTQRVLLGFAGGAALGLVLGAVVGLSRLSSLLLGPVIGAVRAVPSLAWIPLLLVWLQIGEDSKVALIAIGAFFPVYTTVASALHHVDPHLVEAGRAFGLRGWPLFRTVQLPAVIPAVVSGLRLALAQSWLFLVAAELAGASMGLGFLLTDSQNNGRTDRVVLAIVLLAVLGKTTDSMIGLAERRLLRRWGA